MTLAALTLAAIDSDTVVTSVGTVVLGVLGWLSKQMMSLKAAMKGELKTEIKAEENGVKTQISNHPLVVEAKREYASAEAFGRHVAEDRRLHEKQGDEQLKLERMLLEKLEAAKSEILHAGEVRAVAIHQRVNELMESVGRLKGIVEVAIRKGGRA